MYKLVIVEDEQDIRSRIVRLIEKTGSNFEIAAQYETGIDAYDGIISDPPDLILTDIKIPYIDGIELVKMVRKVLPLIKIIIVTGYNEFDYAKEAANLGVVGFINKPVTAEDLSALLKKAEQALDNEFLTVSNLNQLSSFYESSLPIIKENDLYRLSNMADVPAAFENKLRGNNIRLDYRYFAICMFDFDEIPDGESERYDIAFSSIKKSTGEDMGEICDYDTFSRYEKLCFILKSEAPIDMNELEQRLERIIQRVGRYSEMPVSVGISGVYENSRNFAAMVKEAMRALEYRSIMGGNKVFIFDSFNRPAPNISVDDSGIKELGYILHFQPVENSITRINEIKESFARSKDSLYYVATSILNVLIKACDNLEQLYTHYKGSDNLYRRLFEIKTEEEIFDFLKELTLRIRQLNDTVIVDVVDHNLRKIIAYMETHFADPDISFESLAKEVNFSVSYISALLKKKLNTSFVKMLSGLRIEKAKELLCNPALKLIDIAESLGYNDSYYFSHCFKKYTGLSPKEFRSNEHNINKQNV